MIRIKRVKRIALAVKDLDGAIKNWQKLFGVKPFQRGEEPGDKYAYVAFQIGNTWGDGETTIEFLSPMNDPKGEVLLGKYIREHGEGLYMITLETEGTSEEVDKEIVATGLKPAWGGMMKHWDGPEELGFKSWTEHYIHPRDANGALITLASLLYVDRKPVNAEPGKTIYPKK